MPISDLASTMKSSGSLKQGTLSPPAFNPAGKLLQEFLRWYIYSTRGTLKHHWIPRINSILETHPGLSRYGGITNPAAKQMLVSFLEVDISHCFPVAQTIYYTKLSDRLPSPFFPSNQDQCREAVSQGRKRLLNLSPSYFSAQKHPPPFPSTGENTGGLHPMGRMKGNGGNRLKKNISVSSCPFPFCR